MNEKYIRYPKAVLDGEIVACEYVKRACKKYLDWFEREDIEFRTDKAEKIIYPVENVFLKLS
jgi:phage terminase large subunit-like protein